SFSMAMHAGICGRPIMPSLAQKRKRKKSGIGNNARIRYSRKPVEAGPKRWQNIEKIKGFQRTAPAAAGADSAQQTGVGQTGWSKQGNDPHIIANIKYHYRPLAPRRAPAVLLALQELGAFGKKCGADKNVCPAFFSERSKKLDGTTKSHRAERSPRRG